MALGLKFTRWPLGRRPRTSATNCFSSSSECALRFVTVEALETFRPRFLPIVRSRSSDNFPWGVNWDCSAGSKRAEAAASRAGNGDKLQICIEVMCRTRRYN